MVCAKTNTAQAEIRRTRRNVFYILFTDCIIYNNISFIICWATSLVWSMTSISCHPFIWLNKHGMARKILSVTHLRLLCELKSGVLRIWTFHVCLLLTYTFSRSQWSISCLYMFYVKDTLSWAMNFYHNKKSIMSLHKRLILNLLKCRFIAMLNCMFTKSFLKVQHGMFEMPFNFTEKRNTFFWFGQLHLCL